MAPHLKQIHRVASHPDASFLDRRLDHLPSRNRLSEDAPLGPSYDTIRIREALPELAL